MHARTPPDRAYAFIETQFDNLGDALINREMLRLMARHAVVTVGVARAPEAFLAMIGGDAFAAATVDRRRGRSRFLLRVLGDALSGHRCFLFLSPGGWIGEIDGRLNLRSWLHTALYHLLARCGVRICQLGVSYEHPGPKLARLLRWRSRAMFRHVVRDHESRAVASTIGVRIDGIVPDLAFNVFARGGAATEGVTFAFRTDQHSGQFAEVQALVAAVMAAAPPGPVRFVAQVGKDVSASRALRDWFAAASGVTAGFVDATGSIAAAEDAYRCSAVVVSNRLHALLLAGSLGNRMIAAPVGAANAKIAALFADIGLADNVLPPSPSNEAVRRALAASPYDGKRERQRLAEAFAEIFAAPNRNKEAHAT